MAFLSSCCRAALLVAASVFATFAGAAIPDRSIQIVVPFAAGSPPDVLARLLGEVAPVGTPPERLERLRDEAAKALQDPALASRIEALGGSLVVSSPAAFRALTASELPRWRALVKELGIQAD